MPVLDDPEARRLIAEQRQRDIQQMYKNVFNTPEGRKVLGDILLTCHWGVPLNTEMERHEYNIGVYIARVCGIMSDIDAMVGIGED